jgi:hypothetical protein
MEFSSRKIDASAAYTPPRTISFFVLSEFFDKQEPAAMMRRAYLHTLKVRARG